MNPGVVVNLTSLEHVEGTTRIKLGFPRGKVGHFVYLGVTDKKDPKPFDAVAAIKRLGFEVEKPRG